MISSPLADVTSISTIVDIDKALAESMRVLHSRRNALLPISRLPTEILMMVFEYFKEEKHFDESDDVPACLAVTHVCRYWRKVAIGCPALWTSIRSSSPHWVGIMLERSRNAPLVVTYKSTVSLQGCLEPILSQLPRVKVLKICSATSDVNRMIDLLSSQPAPLLEIFDLCNLQPWEDRDLTTRFITDTIFQGQAPRLQRVELGNFSLNWTAHIFSGLQTLSVRGTTFFPTTMPELLSALRRMPALEQLALEKLSMISGPLDNIGKVPLARLKSMALGSLSIQTAKSLFAHLAIPIDAKIALRLTEIDGLEDVSGLFSAMNRYPDTSGSVLQSLRVIHISGRSFCVQLSTSTTMNCPDSWNPHGCDDDIRLSIQFTYRDHEVAPVEPSIMFDICRLVTQPEDRIQTFYFGSDFDVLDRDFWRAGSAFLPDVETIHMNSTFIAGLIDVLEINEGEQESDVSYPSLRTLDIYATYFEYDEPETLRDVMKMRAGRGVPIQALRLEMCPGLNADMVQGFREVGATVDWDEYAEPLEDPDGNYVADERYWVNWADDFGRR